MLYPIESSAMTHLGYDEAGQALYILFDGGRLYAYKAVPKTVFEALQEATSKGQFFQQQIRGQYSFERVRAKQKQ